MYNFIVRMLTDSVFCTRLTCGCHRTQQRCHRTLRRNCKKEKWIPMKVHVWSRLQSTVFPHFVNACAAHIISIVSQIGNPEPDPNWPDWDFSFAVVLWSSCLVIDVKTNKHKINIRPIPLAFIPPEARSTNAIFQNYFDRKIDKIQTENQTDMRSQS